MNSRVYQSKLLIAEGLFRLLEKDAFEELTISEICAEAQVSRNTFYRHFHGKKMIVEFFIKNLLQDYFTKVKKAAIKDFPTLLTFYFRFWREQSYYVNLLKKQHLLGLVFDIERTYFSNMLPTSQLPWHNQVDCSEKFVDLLVIGGMWNILLYWFDCDLNPSADVLAQRVLEELHFYSRFMGK